MKTMFLKIALLLVLVWTSSPVLAGEEANFSGTWILDQSKSELPRMRGRMEEPAGVDLTQIIDHQGPTLKIEQRAKFQGQEHPRNLTYYTDGREAINPDRRGKPITSKSRWEGNKLVTEYTQTWQKPQGAEVKAEVKEVWSLSEDGKVMTVEKTSKMPRGEKKSRLVFGKK